MGSEWVARWIRSSIAFSHHKIEGAKDCYDIADHVARQCSGQNAQIDEGRRADLQAVRRPPSLAVDIEPELAFGIFVAEINLTRRRINPLSHINEVMDQFFHPRQDTIF